MESMVNTYNFFRDRNVLVTGHTGFKGSWLSLWLSMMGAKITGVALDPVNKLDAYNAMGIRNLCTDIRHDINDLTGLKEIINNAEPEIVFHLAAQPLVLESYCNPLYTLRTNIIGTANILEACRNTESVKVIVVITSDKCYDNREAEVSFREDDKLGGKDPYSASKAAAEIVTDAYRNSFFCSGKTGIATARAGNVIGGGDWAVNRLIPDCVRALMKGQVVEIRNPNAVRPWQHVLEPLLGYTMLAVKMYGDPAGFSEPWNFGPEINEARTVNDMAEDFIRSWGEGEILILEDVAGKYEAKYLSLDSGKAYRKLEWKPVLSFQDSVSMASRWYKAQIKGENMYEFTMDQIKKYENQIL